VNFPTSVRAGFSNYANFKGRASRSEFWWFFLFAQLIQMFAQEVSSSTASITSLALLLPSLSIHARRLHDTGRSSKWLIWLGASILGMVLALLGLLMQTAQTIETLDSAQLFDNGSQFWVFTMFVFLISSLISVIVNFVFLVSPSDEGMNNYGPPPPPTL
jgi:uncharacterized membrane protein YhaH (DUF805 family)